MRNKKFLSTVVATALATTMAMPVMAADGGSLDVDVTTKTGVLRVEVPTQMAIAVDQFEITQAGAQIASGEFDMVNKSEMAVKVDVTSTATLGSGINLVSSVDAAKNSDGNDAWLAVAAKTASGSYDDADTDATENFYDLTEANANVTTFGSDDLAAKQTFYLEKGTGSAGYTVAVPKDNKASVSYAQFYELTAIGTQPTDDAELQAEVNKGDVYVVAVAPGTDPSDKDAATKIVKGSTVATGTFAGTSTYYTAADTVTAADAITDGKLYVYASMGTAGEAAGFTYVGKLSNAKDTWTNDDIKKVSIAYDITGVTATKFDEVKNDCTYGLYAPITGPQFNVSASGLITMTGLTADKNFKSLFVQGSDVEGSEATWETSAWTEANGGDLSIQLGQSWMDWLDGESVTAELTLTDNSTIQSAPVTFVK